uniref:Uncharacterized protein n=1 Tax=Panagrolaimus davidi TaxID=227884 RepID=A0A914P7D7_9BILA
MCSYIGQIIFIGLMILCFGLTAGSLFSPGWYRNDQNQQTGILNCQYDNQYSQQYNNNKCNEWWKQQPSSTKAVIILMIIAILVELFAIGWGLASFCACCCRTKFLHGLPICGIIITILLVISMILFGVNHKINKTEGSLEDLDSVSYSFWIGIGATIVAIIATIVGAISAWFSSVLC